MQEPKTGLWVVKRLQRGVLKRITSAEKELRSFWANHPEAQGKIKALRDVYEQLVLMELSLEEDAAKLRQLVDVYGNPIQTPNLIDL